GIRDPFTRPEPNIQITTRLAKTPLSQRQISSCERDRRFSSILFHLLLPGERVTEGNDTSCRTAATRVPILKRCILSRGSRPELISPGLLGARILNVLG